MTQPTQGATALASASNIPVHVFATAEAAGVYAARETAVRLVDAHRERGVMTLGCPGGRSARTTYAALARWAQENASDLRPLHLLMMDEYVHEAGGQWHCCPEEAHYSCLGFGEREIRSVLNDALPEARRVPRAQLHVPAPDRPADYDALIERLGGVDVFLLASGDSDGHVAFNPRGTPLHAPARVIELTDALRRDNLGTFPQFGSLAEVPRCGVSVGTGTIQRHSRAAILLLLGAGKGEALRRLCALHTYDDQWPASVVLACRDAQIVTDAAAVAAMRALA